MSANFPADAEDELISGYLSFAEGHKPLTECDTLLLCPLYHTGRNCQGQNMKAELQMMKTI